ncbi:DCD (Development and cell death) domain protein [Quillaja saponaria]|uniref:DCD (Development and cell death) domain protein n=1 Tax=Quillaja saponaria TaxID=32244 RepID=A0AAD7P8F0_QUISA|nr:DCD (Development and cell death) domain protein [Quillaja saponaria]KAJ7945615.1 DCD (Development and cell death) domain protein [Quillaja saponaria]
MHLFLPMLVTTDSLAMDKERAVHPIAPFHVPPSSAHTPITAAFENIKRDGVQGKEKTRDDHEKLSGFIFMCNGKTKPECYRYRVFGLPAGKKEVVEKIKAGTNLFLFDYDVKLLYGIYTATSSGKLRLERTAFGGRFPAQVRFKIYEDCLPLPEDSFKHAIRDNYQGDSNKFNPELNIQQVRSLLSLFRPLTVFSTTPVYPVLADVNIPWKMPLPSGTDVFQHAARLPPPKESYFSRMSQSEVPSVLNSKHCYRLTENKDHGYSVIKHPTFANGSMLLHADQLHNQTKPLLPEDPFAVGLCSSNVQQVPQSQHAQHRVLTPISDFHGPVVNMGYINPVTYPQAPSASNYSYYSAPSASNYSYYSADVGDQYYPIEVIPSSSQSYQGSGVVQEIFGDQQIGVGNKYYQLSMQRAWNNAQQEENAGYYTNQVSAAPYVQLQQENAVVHYPDQVWAALHVQPEQENVIYNPHQVSAAVHVQPGQENVVYNPPQVSAAVHVHPAVQSQVPTSG